MNWYKTINNQNIKEASWQSFKNLMTQLGAVSLIGLSIGVLSAHYRINEQEAQNMIDQNPEQAAKQVVNIYKLTHPNIDINKQDNTLSDNISDAASSIQLQLEDNTVNELNLVSKVYLQTVASSIESVSNMIDLNKIIQIESAGNSNAVSPVGAAGLMQIMPKTWDDLARKIKNKYFKDKKIDLSFSQASNPSINKIFGKFYMNIEIPRLLKAFGIQDLLETRLAAYNWGIGNVSKTIDQYGKKWLRHAPQETINYIRKYKN